MVITQNALTLNTNSQYGMNVVAQTEKVAKQTSDNTQSKDDALKLSLSTNMRKHSKQHNKDVSDAQDKISLYQVADMSLAEMNKKLYRITQLSIQASSENKTGSDKREIQDEINKLRLEIQNVGNLATFNSKPIFNNTSSTLDGNSGNVINNKENAEFNISTVLDNINSIDVTTDNGQARAVRQSIQALNTVHESRESIASKQVRLEQLINNENNDNTDNSTQMRNSNEAMELVNVLNSSILEQSSDALYVQANQQNAAALALLQ